MALEKAIPPIPCATRITSHPHLEFPLDSPTAQYTRQTTVESQANVDRSRMPLTRQQLRYGLEISILVFYTNTKPHHRPHEPAQNGLRHVVVRR